MLLWLSFLDLRFFRYLRGHFRIAALLLVLQPSWHFIRDHLSFFGDLRQMLALLPILLDLLVEGLHNRLHQLNSEGLHLHMLTCIIHDLRERLLQVFLVLLSLRLMSLDKNVIVLALQLHIGCDFIIFTCESVLDGHLKLLPDVIDCFFNSCLILHRLLYTFVFPSSLNLIIKSFLTFSMCLWNSFMYSTVYLVKNRENNYRGWLTMSRNFSLLYLANY